MDHPQKTDARSITIGLNAVIVAVTDESPRVLTVRGPGKSRSALPFGPLDPERDRTLEKGVRGWVAEQTGLQLEYVEQLYTFADRDRDPIERSGGPRGVSIAYLALVREGILARGSRARWTNYYGFLPWEDWRSGRPSFIDRRIVPQLNHWIKKAPNREERRIRAERTAISFGFGTSGWDTERVLERYELLYQAGIVTEALLEGGSGQVRSDEGALGRGMVLDHRRMLATALGRLRGKIRYRPVVFELLPPSFTLLQLQRVVESLAGVPLHKQNFRRLVEKGGLVEGTGRLDRETGGRPAEMFRFRRDVLQERRAPGLGIPS